MKWRVLKFCIMWPRAMSINSYYMRSCSFLQQMHPYPPQTRDKRQFQGFDLQGGLWFLFSCKSFSVNKHASLLLCLVSKTAMLWELAAACRIDNEPSKQRGQSDYFLK